MHPPHEFAPSLICSVFSHRQTVDVAIETTIPKVINCSAISLQLHLANGRSKSVGLLQAIAVTCARTIAWNIRGRPGRGASSKLRVWHHRLRHFRTRAGEQPTVCATCASVQSGFSAVVSMIKARLALLWPVLRASACCCNSFFSYSC